jgi:hypothetical protein
MWRSAMAALLLQLRVLGFGFFQDRDVWIGVFPKGKKIFVRRKRTDAGSVAIRWRIFA